MAKLWGYVHSYNTTDKRGIIMSVSEPRGEIAFKLRGLDVMKDDVVRFSIAGSSPISAQNIRIEENSIISGNKIYKVQPQSMRYVGLVTDIGFGHVKIVGSIGPAAFGRPAVESSGALSFSHIKKGFCVDFVLAECVSDPTQDRIVWDVGCPTLPAGHNTFKVVLFKNPILIGEIEGSNQLLSDCRDLQSGLLTPMVADVCRIHVVKKKKRVVLVKAASSSKSARWRAYVNAIVLGDNYTPAVLLNAWSKCDIPLVATLDLAPEELGDIGRRQRFITKCINVLKNDGSDRDRLAGLVFNSRLFVQHILSLPVLPDSVVEFLQNAILMAARLPMVSLTAMAQMGCHFAQEVLKNSSEKGMSFLAEVFMATSTAHSAPTAVVTEPHLTEWTSLPPVALARELRDSFTDTCRHLPIMKIQGPFECQENYLDTMFRLFRADCFASLVDGVCNMRAGKLDARDMSVYRFLGVQGLEITPHGRGLNLVIKFEALNPPPRGWRKTKWMAHGNLLAISEDPDFKSGDPIWATVVKSNKVDGDVKKLENGIVAINLVEDGVHTLISTLMALMRLGNATMIESRSFYHCYAPVLSRLQQLNTKTLPFSDLLVKLESSNEDIPTTVVNESPFMSKFDSSQLEAFEQAINQSVSLIVGPPGTGKSFMGVAVVDAFLRSPEFKESSILIVTHKNHILDEFLVDCLALDPPPRIVRMGSRSQEPRLAPYLLSEWSRAKPSDPDDERYIKPPVPKSAWDALSLYFDTVNSLKMEVEPAIHSLIGQLARAISKKQSDILELFLTEASNQQTASLGLNKDDLTEEQRRKLFWDWLHHVDYVKNLEKAVDNSGSHRNDPEFTISRRNGSEEDDEGLDDDVLERSEHYNHMFSASNARDVLDIPAMSAATATSTVGDSSVLLRTDLRRIDRGMRVQFMISLMARTVQNALPDLEEHINKYAMLSKQCRDQHDDFLAAALRGRCNAIGVTVTGAATFQKVIASIKPEIVIVEEAAEVLESRLVAALPASVRRLVMIGDHNQLRPQVESHKLAIDHHLDVSLFERLIRNNIRSTSLLYQNRMRVELVPPLLTSYPGLQSNLRVVRDRRSVEQLPFNMLFWDYDSEIHKETASSESRSKSNPYEARCVTLIAAFLILEGYQSESIVILTAYLGQKYVIKEEIDKLCKLKFGPPSSIKHIPVSTIDEYQGDEADIVLVSLVRSNSDGDIGFLNKKNRFTVAISRARCAWIFVGSKSTLNSRTLHWQQLMSSEYVTTSRSLPLRCPRHNRVYEVKQPDQISPSRGVCSLPCNAIRGECGHVCELPCHAGSHGKCNVPVAFRFPICGHSATRECWEDVSRLMCAIPCTRKRKCGHPCSRICGENCDVGSCKVCIKEALERKEAEIKEARKNIARQIAQMHKNPTVRVSKTQLSTSDHRYTEICDKVNTTCHPKEHGEALRVTKIEELSNPKLLRDFLEAQSELLDPSAPTRLLFHGTSKAGVEGIPRTGFRLPSPSKNNMYGCGIYFANDATKSSQKLYTKGMNIILGCEVALGNVFTMDTGGNELDQRIVRQQYRSDSVYAKRDTKATGGVLFDEFVVYDPRLALPRYLIHFERLSLRDDMFRIDTPAIWDKSGFSSVVLRPQGTYSGKATFYDYHFRLAESQFLRTFGSAKKVTSVRYVRNRKLEMVFEDRKGKLASKGHSTDELLLFHGTASTNIDGILRNGFKVGGRDGAVAHGTALGHGVYLAESGSVAQGYAGQQPELLFCRVLPGRSSTAHTDDGRHGCDSYRDNGVIVAHEAEQVLPCYVVKYE